MNKDTVQVIVANASAISLTWTNINQALTTVSLILAIGFTIYKFLKHPKE